MLKETKEKLREAQVEDLDKLQIFAAHVNKIDLLPILIKLALKR